MKDNSIADVSHTEEFDRMYQEMVKQAEDKYKVKSEHPETEEEVKDFVAKVLRIKEEITIPDNYEVWDDKGNVISTSKIIIREKKKEYPKTYAECCRVLGVSEFEYNHTGTNVWYRHKLMATLDKLILCRDAYCKIAGEEMSLDGPWKPDWTSGKPFYCISVSVDIIGKGKWCTDNKILAFPTEEMRDVFYENFKKEIEICKELL